MVFNISWWKLVPVFLGSTYNLSLGSWRNHRTLQTELSYPNPLGREHSIVMNQGFLPAEIHCTLTTTNHANSSHLVSYLRRKISNKNNPLCACHRKQLSSFSHFSSLKKDHLPFIRKNSLYNNKWVFITKVGLISRVSDTENVHFKMVQSLRWRMKSKTKQVLRKIPVHFCSGSNRWPSVSVSCLGWQHFFWFCICFDLLLSESHNIFYNAF